MEEYYHILGVSGSPHLAEWDKLPARVEIGLMRLFELLQKHEVKATLFFLGYIAKKHPHLVKHAVDLGHEIASHGMYHIAVNTQTAKEFIADAKDCKMLLEDIAQKQVRAYRSAGFLIDTNTSWFFEALLEAGYLYDSSIVPNRKQLKDVYAVSDTPFPIHTANGTIFEFPISTANLGSLKINMFGGGYLRFFPLSWIKYAAKSRLLKSPLLIYIHPREMDLQHPKIKMNPYRKFKSYINLKSVEPKLEALLGLCQYSTLGDYYDSQARSQY